MMTKKMGDAVNEENSPPLDRKPPWLKVRLPTGAGYRDVDRIIHGRGLHTVCESAQCPNLGECWDRGTATIMILGDICTRACGFCAVKTGSPIGLDREEPERVAAAVAAMRLRHVVVTSVNRDDLADGGAEIWARTIRAIRVAVPGITVEVLIPDFLGDWNAAGVVFEAAPDILAHNLETVERLTPKVRSRASWDRSLELLGRSRAAGLRTKTGIMLGLGEETEEIRAALRASAGAGAHILTLGQYLRPSRKHLPVARWVTPEEFAAWKREGEALGLKHVESGPLVRSSYHAEEQATMGIGG